MPSFGSAMAEFAREVASERDPQQRMQYMVDAATSWIGSCSDAGLSVLTDRTTVETLAATGERPRHGDEWQYELGQGPCLEAIYTRPMVHVYDLVAAYDRWPQWAPRIVDELGIRSMLCVRLYTRGSSLGALNLYGEQPNSFDHDEREDALVLAAHAAAALAASHEVDAMHVGMGRRTVLGQATGILMERYGLDAHAAFEVLRRVSQQRNRKVHDIAVELVAEGKAEGL